MKRYHSIYQQIKPIDSLGLFDVIGTYWMLIEFPYTVNLDNIFIFKEYNESPYNSLGINTIALNLNEINEYLIFVQDIEDSGEV